MAWRGEFSSVPVKMSRKCVQEANFLYLLQIMMDLRVSWKRVKSDQDEIFLQFSRVCFPSCILILLLEEEEDYIRRSFWAYLLCVFDKNA